MNLEKCNELRKVFLLSGRNSGFLFIRIYRSFLVLQLVIDYMWLTHYIMFNTTSLRFHRI